MLLYGYYSTRLGYKIPDKPMGTTAKAGYAPVWMVAMDVFLSFWGNLTQEVNVRTHDAEAVNAMLTLANDTTNMMVVPPFTSQRELDNLWVKTVHRILHRLDLACHHVDLSFLAKEAPNEERHAELRVMNLVAIARPAPQRAFPSGGGGFNGRNKRFRPSGPSQDRPMQFCEYHKKDTFHSSKECRLNPANKKEGASAGK
jgi:hypothetical protein